MITPNIKHDRVKIRYSFTLYNVIRGRVGYFKQVDSNPKVKQFVDDGDSFQFSNKDSDAIIKVIWYQSVKT